MDLFTGAANSTVLGDMYALQQLLYKSDVGRDKLFYFKLEEGSFARPSFFIKLVSSTVDMRNKNYRDANSEMMIMYFADDFYDAHVVKSALESILTGGGLYSDTVLPRYDFTTSPPTECSISGWNNNEYYYEGDGVMGARIDPTTVSIGGVIQEENRGWNVPVTFTMRSPVPTFQDGPLIEDVIVNLVSGQPSLPYTIGACTRGVPEVEVTLQ